MTDNKTPSILLTICEIMLSLVLGMILLLVVSNLSVDTFPEMSIYIRYMVIRLTSKLDLIFYTFITTIIGIAVFDTFISSIEWMESILISIQTWRDKEPE